MSFRLPSVRRRAAIHVGALHQQDDRVTSTVDGEDIWWSCHDSPLDTSPEALVATLLLPALRARRPIQVEGRLDDRFVGGIGRVMALAKEWWGHRAVRLVDDRGRVKLDVSSPDAIDADDATPDRLSALAFSGGVDSFYSLLEHGGGLAALVFVRGFDLRHWFDADILDGAESSTRHVAAESGLRAIVVETNLRDHHLFQDVNWPLDHGGAIAGVGHLLAETIDALWISAAYAVSRQYVPYGTHARLDPLWTSERVTLRHVGDDRIREEKVAVIGAHPMVERHLRVCWAQPTPDGNCGRCEKCLRTRLALMRQHPDIQLSCFPPADTLADHIDALDRIDPDRHRTLELMLGVPTPPAVARAIGALLDRSAD